MADPCVPIQPDDTRPFPRVILVPHGFETNYTVGYARGLLANGVTPLVVSADSDCRELAQAGVPNVNLRGRQGAARPALSKALTLVRYYFGLLRLLARERGCTLHFTGIFKNRLILFEGIVLQLAFRRLSGCYVYTAHNVLPHGVEGSRLFARVYRFIYRIPDRIIVHSPGARLQLIERFGVPGRKVRVAPIGLNEEVPLTSLTRAEARKRLGYAEADRVLLFFGKAEPYKGLDLLVHALDDPALPPVKLLVSCSFPHALYRPAVIGAIERSRRKADIRLHEGFVANEEIEVFFKAADVLVLPYREITQSGVVFLGWRFGLPIVATDVGSMREYIDDEAGILAARAEPLAIAEAIRLFFQGRKRFRRTTIAARANRYRWGAVCRDLVPLYRESRTQAAA